MNQPIVVWCMIAGVLLCAFVFRAIERYYSVCHHHGHRPRHVLEIGKEKDIFFIPGDDEDDESEDL